ncbi:hypothetical protein ACN47E_004889 [Coniothyrium glycines]
MWRLRENYLHHAGQRAEKRIKTPNLNSITETMAKDFMAWLQASGVFEANEATECACLHACISPTTTRHQDLLLATPNAARTPQASNKGTRRTFKDSRLHGTRVLKDTHKSKATMK